MDLSTALKTEALRPLGTTFIPAIVALAPGLTFQVIAHPEILKFYKENATASNTVLFLAILLSGMLLENLGSWIEDHVWEGFKDKASDEAWIKYLKSPKDQFPTAASYIRSLVGRMKFEVSMFPGVLVNFIFGVSSACMTDLLQFCSWPTMIWGLVTALLAYYFYKEAEWTVKNLDCIRQGVY